MIRIATGLATVALMGLGGCATVSEPVAPVTLSDAGRPDADRLRDADRKPAEMIAFAGVRPGQKIAELSPGGGYYTRILSGVVGSSGRVYAVGFRASPALEALGTSLPNVTPVVAQPGTIPAPEPVDLVWTTQNYHDFKNAKVGERDAAAALNEAAFRALKPGGIYLISDHATAAGAGASQTSSLHRIDPALVRREVEAAGFRFDGSSDILHYTSDDHTLRVQESGVRGRTDQFVLRFRKPR